ncbi:MAG TPA: UDP-3-O-(3-hydroxymyristoyl)glucosamine N-acyltransferase [Candidatus Binatia bacterium]|nr:UDP-3-O-(3-hydroxymyristoyl)glucosamine N-acyltransferase [Candidatus Binatia bacterium]
MKLGDVANAIGATVEGDAALEVDDLQPLESAGPRSLSFVSNPRYIPQLRDTRAGAVILGPDVEGPGCAVLRVPNAYLGFAQALAVFARPVVPPLGVDASARVDPAATIGDGARIGAQVSIAAGVRIGRNCTLFPGVVVYPDVTIGDDCVLHANVVLRERVRIGNRVVLGSGVAVGGDGFGFLPFPGGGVFKLQQIGTVEIADDVEVGANTTIDRATIGVTRIERGAKLDNLVMVAHGCTVGEEALLAAQVGLAGSTTIGARVQLGGQVGTAGHLTVGEGARVAAQSGVPNDVAAGATVGGYPAMDAALWRRVSAAIHRLPDLLRRVRRLERRLGTTGSGTGDE